MLILKSASKFRPSGHWSDDDYDVFDGERHIGPHHARHGGTAGSSLVLVDHRARPAKHA
jgi:hypothetical protein